MNILMFLVGFVIFTAYAGFLFWNIFYNHNKNREENYPGYYQRHQPDSIDLDGMGNQGRFPIDPPPRTKAKKRKKGSQSRSKNYNWKDKKEDVE